MAYENFIGLRYLMAKQRGCVVSLITFLSIAGVTLGVTAMIVVLSVMGGFKQDLKQKILGTKAHMVVKSSDGELVKDPEEVFEVVDRVDGLVGAASFLEAEVMASSPTNLGGVMFRGVDPERIGQVSDLDDALVHEKAKGRLSNLNHPDWSVSKLRREDADSGESLREKIEGAKGGFGDDLPEFDAGRIPVDPSGEPDAGPRRDVGTGGAEPEDEEADAGGAGMPPIVPSKGASGGTAEGSSPGADDGGTESAAESEMPPIAGEESDPADAELPPVEGPDDSSGDGESQMPSIAGEDSGGSGEEETAQVPGILIGKELAKSLKVGLGDEINVVTPQAEMGPSGPIPRSRPFRVVGIFYTGMYEYDANYAYAALGEAQDFLDKEGATGVEVKSTDVDRAIPLAAELQKALADKYDVRDWKEMNRSLFYALKLEKIAMFVVLTFIILVASFSIIAMLIMIVLEKKRDISVLKSMGVTDRGIMRIFIYQGIVIGGVGAALGLIFGLTICFLLVQFGWPLNSQVYYISTLPVDVDWVEVGLVVAATVFISFVATIYPSWQAAQLTPVEGLRYE